MDIALNTVAIISFLVAIVSFLVAIASLVHAIVIRRKTKKETQASVNFIKELIVNSAPDPSTVRTLLDEYNTSGEWRNNVFLGKDGKYHLNTTITPTSARLSPTTHPPRVEVTKTKFLRRQCFFK